MGDATSGPCERCGSEDWEHAYLGNGCDRCTPERIRGAFDAARLLAKYQHVNLGHAYECPACEERQPCHLPDCAIVAALRLAGLA